MRRRGLCAALRARHSALVAAFLAVIGGCGGDARVELAAADALDGVAEQMRITLHEYHGEVSAFDDSRETQVTAAFITRIRKDADDADKCDAHAQAFASALAKIRGDRDVEQRRLTNAAGQVDAVTEVARGLRRIGIESLTLQDEMRRYLQSLIDAHKRARAEAAAARSAQGPRVPTSMPAALQRAAALLKAPCVDGTCK